MLGVQRLDLRACLGQRALDSQGLLERAARARRLVVQTLRPRSTTASGVRDSGMTEAASPRPEESAKTWSQALSRRVSAFSWAEA